LDEKDKDQEWLDTLAGRGESNTLSAPEQREAQLLRKAVLHQIEARDKTFDTSEAGFRNLMAEAGKRHLLQSDKRRWQPMLALQKIYDILAHPAGVMAAVAIILGLGITLHLQTLELRNRPEPETVRGGASAERITLRVNDLNATTQEWQRDLLQVKVEHTVSFESSGRVLIRLRLTPDALALLQSRRIQAPAGEWCTLAIEASVVRK